MAEQLEGPLGGGLHEAPRVLEKVRMAELGHEAIRNTRPRPISPYHSDMCLGMGARFVRSPKVEGAPDEALGALLGQPEEVVSQGQRQ